MIDLPALCIAGWRFIYSIYIFRNIPMKNIKEPYMALNLIQ